MASFLSSKGRKLRGILQITAMLHDQTLFLKMVNIVEFYKVYFLILWITKKKKLQ